MKKRLCLFLLFATILTATSYTSNHLKIAYDMDLPPSSPLAETTKP
jgi:hypothetical protein